MDWVVKMDDWNDRVVRGSTTPPSFRIFVVRLDFRGVCDPGSIDFL